MVARLQRAQSDRRQTGGSTTVPQQRRPTTMKGTRKKHLQQQDTVRGRRTVEAEEAREEDNKAKHMARPEGARNERKDGRGVREPERRTAPNHSNPAAHRTTKRTDEPEGEEVGGGRTTATTESDRTT